MKTWFKAKLEKYKDDPEFILEEFLLEHDELVAKNHASPLSRKEIIVLEYYANWLKDKKRVEKCINI